ncbi:MAG: glycosyltransferase [Phycisphaeraceae bacterium]|nr:glycosyltransferase [Phycisphaeraceae bacterium]
MDVVVAFRNEAGLIGAKVRNLLALDYPHHRLRFFMVDGGSTDGSSAAARHAANGDGRFCWLSLSNRGKTYQLNRAFARASASWVLVTDADARLPRGALRRMVARGEAADRVGLVGAICHPRRAILVDRVHWTLWNWVRGVEGILGCATALGTCYLIRRGVFAGWPEDVVADDVHASLAINLAGLQAVLADVVVLERRAPSGICSFAWHKVRKARAVVREFVRFVPKAGSFRPMTRVVFLVRAIALLLCPFVLPALAAGFAFAYPKVAAVVGFAILCSWGLASAPWPVVHWPARCLRAAGMVLILSFVLTVAIVTCPFVRQNAVFCRWKQEEA